MISNLITLKKLAIFKYLLNNRQIRNIKNYFRTKKAIKNSDGQIKLESPVGKMLYEFINNYDISKVLEIGTWNGRGSTDILYNSLNNQKKIFDLTSLETDKIAYKSAKKYFRGKKIKLELGRIIEISDLPDPHSIDYRKHGLSPKNIEWFIQDIRRYEKILNIFHKIEREYDFILFDGGEFSTFAEFLMIYKHTKYFGLDDINDYKQYEVLKYILKNSSEFDLIETKEDFSIYRVIN